MSEPDTLASKTAAQIDGARRELYRMAATIEPLARDWSNFKSGQRPGGDEGLKLMHAYKKSLQVFLLVMQDADLTSWPEHELSPLFEIIEDVASNLYRLHEFTENFTEKSAIYRTMKSAFCDEICDLLKQDAKRLSLGAEMMELEALTKILADGRQAE